MNLYKLKRSALLWKNEAINSEYFLRLPKDEIVSKLGISTSPNLIKVLMSYGVGFIFEDAIDEEL